MNIKKAIEKLQAEIPNILDFYDEQELRTILRGLDTTLDEVVDTFVDEVVEDCENIRRCDYCGKLMHKGYYLDGEYACSDKCRNEIYKRDTDASTDEEAEILYLINYYMLKPEEVAGMTAKEIDEKYNEREFTSENVYWTSWND